jgi:hypothetical protein
MYYKSNDYLMALNKYHQDFSTINEFSIIIFDWLKVNIFVTES